MSPVARGPSVSQRAAAIPPPQPLPPPPPAATSSSLDNLFERNLGPSRSLDELGIDYLANPRKRNDSDSEAGGPDDRTEFGDDRTDYGGGGGGRSGGAESTFEQMFSDQQPTGGLGRGGGDYDGDDGDGGGDSQNPSSMTYEQIQDQKAWILSKFRRLEQSGMPLPRRFSMESNLSEMKTALKRLKKEVAL